MKKKTFKVKLTRAERNMVIKRRLFGAAVKVVGEYGYSEASIARITLEAGVSAGTFYNHFENRQQLLDELLPTVGEDMLDFIRDRTDSVRDGVDREINGFNAFFAFLTETPEFVRILNEAELFAPTGFKKHMDNVASGYKRLLIRARERGQLLAFTDDEIEALVYMLLGMRSYLSSFYASGAATSVQPPSHVFSAYEKFIRNGMFKALPLGRNVGEVAPAAASPS